MVLLEDKDQLYVYLLDKNLKGKSVIKTNHLPSNYKKFLGFSIQENSYTVYFSNSQHTRFGALVIDFDKNKVEQQLMDFRLKKERFIESVSHDNSFFIVSASKKVSEINIYRLNGFNNFTSHKIPAGSLDYRDPQSQFGIKLITILRNSSIGSTLIASDNPNAIDTTSKNVKFYISKNNLIITFDNRIENTHMPL